MTDSTTQLSPREAAALLEATSATIRAEVGALSEGLASWHPAPGEWCAKEVMGHIIEAERRGFAGRIRTILASPEPDLATWDQEAVARDRCDCARPAADLLAEFLELLRAIRG